jgi:tyrosinase
VRDLTLAQRVELRAAFTAMMAISDERGYQYYAGIHGLPLPAWCDRYGHGKPTFLHWHRAYLYRFELALRATGHDVMLPWWDWLDQASIPTLYSEKHSPDGSINPLCSVEINSLALEQGRRGLGDEEAVPLSREPNTRREPGLPGTRLPTDIDIEKVLGYSDFATFDSKLEDWHGEVHVWVGGHMTDIPFAAYDPIFWAHHCMIDRIWRIWQLKHPAASLPATLQNQVMQPFGVTAGQTLDTTVLGYDYAASSTPILVK